MPALPNNNTSVYYVDYTVGGHDHTLPCRFYAPNVAADAAEAVVALLEAIADDYLYLLTVRGARVLDAGTNVTYPVDWPGELSYGSGAGVEAVSANFLGFVGRDVYGHRVAVHVFGSKVNVDAGKFRIFTGASPAIEAAYQALSDAEGAFITVGRNDPNWKPYANLGNNAYWRNKIR